MTCQRVILFEPSVLQFSDFKRGRVSHLQDLFNELGSLVVAMHEGPLVSVDLQVNYGAAEVILKARQHIVLPHRAPRSRHRHIVIGAT